MWRLVKQIHDELEKNANNVMQVIMAFMLYIRQFTYPPQNIFQALSSIQSMAAACERVFEFLSEEEMEEGHKTTMVN